MPSAQCMVACRSGTETGRETISLPKLIGLANRDTRLQPASGHGDRKRLRLMTAATTAVKSRGTTEFGRDDNQRFIEQLLLFEIGDERGQEPSRVPESGGAGSIALRCAYPNRFR